MRIQKLCQRLPLPCLIQDPLDLYYLTGLMMTRGRLLASPAGAHLFVDGRYIEKAKQLAPCPVHLFEEQKNHFTSSMAFDSAAFTYDGYLTLKKEFPHTEWTPLPNPVKPLRAIKDTSEIALLRKAAQLTSIGYRHILSLLKVGVSEEEIALEFELFCRKNGASAISFNPIIAFGENSAYPHYRAGKTRLQNNQLVLCDMGAVVEHYHGDMTRMFHFGKIDPRLEHFEQLVREAQHKAIDAIKPGMLGSDVDKIVRMVFDRSNVKPLYIHSLGHGVGLDLHEEPRIYHEREDVVIQPGMVFTIEPGLYQPGLGGIRIEDMILVTEKGAERLTDA
jgi:Xaa-Pro aminopeptidase